MKNKYWVGADPGGKGKYGLAFLDEDGSLTYETALPEGCRHLTNEDRCRIGALKESGLSIGAIAARPWRDRTAVWRELRRNACDGGHSPGEAQARAAARRSRTSGVPRKMTPERRAYVDALLAEGFSPEQISRRLRLEGDWSVGRQWIYGHVKASGKPRQN